MVWCDVRGAQVEAHRRIFVCPKMDQTKTPRSMDPSPRHHAHKKQRRNNPPQKAQGRRTHLSSGKEFAVLISVISRSRRQEWQEWSLQDRGWEPRTRTNQMIDIWDDVSPRGRRVGVEDLLLYHQPHIRLWYWTETFKPLVCVQGHLTVGRLSVFPWPSSVPLPSPHPRVELLPGSSRVCWRVAPMLLLCLLAAALRAGIHHTETHLQSRNLYFKPVWIYFIAAVGVWEMFLTRIDSRRVPASTALPRSAAPTFRCWWDVCVQILLCQALVAFGVRIRVFCVFDGTTVHGVNLLCPIPLLCTLVPCLT